MRRCRPAALIAGVLLAAGCGADDAPAPPTTAAATTAAASATGPTTISPTTTASRPTSTAPTVADLLALGRPIVLAHTGGEEAHPGSTMYAFGESVRAGVDLLDLNVVLSRDGVLMVQHDETVDRQTDGSGAVAAMTAAELQALDNAYWFTAAGVGPGHPDDDYIHRGIRAGQRPPPVGYTADDFAIPRLDELIARHPDLPLNIEIKEDGEAGIATARALADLLAATGRNAVTVVTSFDDATVDAFHALAPDVEVSPGLDASTAFVLDGTPLPYGMRILQLPPEYQGIPVLTPDTVAAAHAAGYVIWVWPTVPESRALYDELLAAGVDGLNANLPSDAVAAVQVLVETT